MFQRGRFGLNQGKEEGQLRLALFICAEITMPRVISPIGLYSHEVLYPYGQGEILKYLLRFIESEWALVLFTKSFYNRLSMCFGYIAHYVEGVIMRSVSRILRRCIAQSQNRFA
jgi:hypothetical protein